MLTKWGKKVVAANNVSATDSIQMIPCAFTSNIGAAMIEAKTAVDNTTVYISPKAETGSFGFIASASVLASNPGVAVGSGNTPPSENDYSLEQQITGLSAGSTPSSIVYYDKENWKYCVRLDYALSNNTGSDVTIKEIGLFRRFYTASTRGDNASSSAKRTVMIDRTVLSQPITIPNGGAATVRYEFVYDA